MSWHSFLRAMELFVATGGTVLIFWSISVNRIRTIMHDFLAGPWLAMSYGLLLLGMVGGSLTRYHDGVLPTPWILVGAAGVLCGIIAMVKGFKNYKNEGGM